MLEAAHRRQFDIVLCWALDRLSREGMVATVGYLQRLTDAGVAFHSYSEPYLATDSEIARNILLACMSSLAKVERARISERTKAGLARVRAKGTSLGRPALAGDVQAKIFALVRAEPNMSSYAVGKRLGIDLKTASKYMSAAIVR